MTVHYINYRFVISYSVMEKVRKGIAIHSISPSDPLLGENVLIVLVHQALLYPDHIFDVCSMLF